MLFAKHSSVIATLFREFNVVVEAFVFYFVDVLWSQLFINVLLFG